MKRVGTRSLRKESDSTAGPAEVTFAGDVAIAGPIKDVKIKVRSSITKVERVPFKKTLELSNPQKFTTAQAAMAMSELRYKQSSFPEGEIEAITISIASAEEIKESSVCQVMDDSVEAVPGSINDPRMGVIEDRKPCLTCNMGSRHCPGHNGFVEMNEPIIHPLYINYVINILKCVCNKCSRVLIDRSTLVNRGILNFKGVKRIEKIKQIMGTGRSFPCNRECGPDDIACVSNPVFDSKASKERKLIIYSRPIKGKKSATQAQMSGREVYDILAGISDEDADLLGFGHHSHPRNMIIQNLVVIPPTDRPPAILGGSGGAPTIQQNQLTELYREVIKVNNKLVDATGEERNLLVRDLIARVSALFNNSTGSVEIGGQPASGIQQLLSGKRGAIRGSASGKRTEYTARSVVDVDPDLSFGEVSVPREVAENITNQRHVTPSNLKFMQHLLERGQVKSVIKNWNQADQQIFQIDDSTVLTYKVSVGDVLEVRLQLGDVLVANRQPTISMYSMVGLVISKITDTKNFGMSMHMTKAFNMDFDGDEINFHFPRTTDSEADVRALMNAQKCFLGPGYNVVAPVFDALIGVYLMTQDLEVALGPRYDDNLKRWIWKGDRINFYELPVIKDKTWTITSEKTDFEVNIYVDKGRFKTVFIKLVDTPGIDSGDIVTETGSRVMWTRHFEIDEWSDIIMTLRNSDAILNPRGDGDLASLEARCKLYGVPLRSGRALFSALLPEDFYFKSVGKIGIDERENTVLIQDGILIQGFITKGHVGHGSGSIGHRIALQYGIDRAADFNADITMMMDQYLTVRGFTIGIGDCIPPTEAQYRKKEEIIRREMQRVQLKIDQLGGVRGDPVEEEKRQAQLAVHANNIGAISAHAALQAFSPENSFLMATDVAKGSTANFGQATGSIGMIYKGGRVIPAQLTGDTRRIAYAPVSQGDTAGLESMGYIESSYLVGMTPRELFFANAGTRPNIIESVNSVPLTGALSRRMVKVLEDIKIVSDGSVRGSDDRILDPAFGGDGFGLPRLQYIKGFFDGKVASPIDFRSLAEELNVKYGRL